MSIAKPLSRGLAAPITRAMASGTPQEVNYAIRDEFLTNESAPIASPRSAEPGPGTWIANQNAGVDDLEIVANAMQVANHTAINIPGIVSDDSLPRVAGRMIVADITLAAGTSYCAPGFRAIKVSTLQNECVFVLGGWIYKKDPAQAQLDFVGISGQVRVAVVLRAAGIHCLLYTGTEWKLIWVGGARTDPTLYPSVCFYSGDDLPMSRVAVPDADYLWSPTAILSDSFDRGDSSDLGTTDGAGVEETGGAGISWVKQVGAAEISSNAMAITSAGGITTADAGESDVVIVGVVTPVAASKCAVVLRYVDANNHWLVELDPTADTLSIIEVAAGVPTSRDSTSVTITGGTAYELVATCDDEDIAAYLNGGNRVAYGSAASGKTATLFGLTDENGNGGALNSVAVFQRSVTGLVTV